VLGEGDRPLAVFGLADQPRAEAATAVRDLREAGLRRVVMLTGDNEQVAHSVSAQVGLDEYRAGLLPEDKLRAVEELDREDGPVAMVGDGINDAPALAAASVGVAMGAAGTDAALASADVALMSDDLGRLPDTVRGARQATRVMRQNVIASLAVKAVFVVLAPLGLVTLVMAVAADMGMSLLVTLNGLRLLRAGETARASQDAASPKPAACADGCCSHE
jgi:Cd2+/Zn2+-exporting ATPase